VLAKADPFREEALKDVEAEIFHLGTLLADDFSLDVLKALSQRGTLAVDAQGYLREVRDEQVYAVDWKEKREAMQYIDILKVNEHEMEVLTGMKDLRAAAKVLADWGVKEVLLTLGSLGSVILAEGVYYDIPAYAPREVVDATGCGDTYMTGYLYRRALGDSYEQAGKFAAAMSTLKLEKTGPFSRTEEEVMDIIRNS
jgi:sugar/nucleoside kinase (ribokinase family)